MGRMSRLKSIRRGDELCALAPSGSRALTIASAINTNATASRSRRKRSGAIFCLTFLVMSFANKKCETKYKAAFNLTPLNIAARLEDAGERVAIGLFNVNADALRAHSFEIVTAQPLVIVVYAGQLRPLFPVLGLIKDGILLDRLRLWRANDVHVGRVGRRKR